MNQHFLQSTAWQAFQESLGRTTFRDSGPGWEYLAILERSTGNSRLYCPYGPTADDEHSLAAALDSLAQLGAGPACRPRAQLCGRLDPALFAAACRDDRAGRCHGRAPGQAYGAGGVGALAGRVIKGH